MAKHIGTVVIFSILVIFANSKPMKHKKRDSEIVKVEEKVEETVSEERNETLFTVLTKFNDFYTDILPELRLTLSRDCDEDKLNATKPKLDLTPASSLDCLTLDAVACAASLKKQFNEKVKEEYVKEIKTYITKTLEAFTAILKELPANDAHEFGVRNFVYLIQSDLPKLNSAIDLGTLDQMFRAMHDSLKPKFPNTKFDEESTKQYEELLKKHASDRPSMEELNENRTNYVNKIWNELVEDLRAVELFKRL